MSERLTTAHPAFQLSGIRPHDADKLPPGIRVRHDYGKWERTARGYEKDPQWAARPYASTRVGVTVTDADFSPYHPGHAWACPGFATAVLFDGFERPTWVRTVSLEAIGFQQADESQPELELSL